MSLTNTIKNNFKNVQLPVAFITSGLILFTMISSVAIGLKLENFTKFAGAAGANTVDIILGQKVVGNTVVASVCLIADTAISIGDTGVWLKYDATKLTPNATLTSKGIYDGPADLSGSYAPMTWNLVSGKTDTYTMKAIFNSNPVLPIPNSTAATNNTPGLFASATFNIGSGSGSNTISVDNTGTGVLKRPGNVPLTTSVINFAGDCTAYTGGGTAVTPTLGTAPSTAITGTVGSSLPNITLIGTNLPAGAAATFTPAGGTAITGSISNNVFTPNSPATISSGSLPGPRTGVMSVTNPTGVASLNIPTNFSPAIVITPTPTIGSVANTITNPITGSIGGNFGSIPLIGNTFTNGTPATFTPAGATTAIQGAILNGNFVANQNQPIPAGTLTGPRTGVLMVSGNSLNVPTNFSPAIITNNTSNGGGGTISIGENANLGRGNSLTPTIAPTANEQTSPQPKEELTVAPQSNFEALTPKTTNVKIQNGTDANTIDINSVRTGGINLSQVAILLIISAIFARFTLKSRGGKYLKN
jgi:hypothetical protein